MVKIKQPEHFYDILHPRRNREKSTALKHYLRQVNEVNGGDNAFVRCVSVFLSVCAADRPVRPV